jgi:hypothetical protein
LEGEVVGKSVTAKCATVSARAGLFVVCVLTTAFVTAAACGVAFAQGEAPSRGGDRTLTFLDPRPVDVEFTRGQKRKETLTVEVRNRARRRAQKVRVRIVGLQPSTPKSAKALTGIEAFSKTRRKTVPAHSTRRFHVRIKTTKPPPAATYTGVLVAVGELGGVRRRDFSLVVRPEKSSSDSGHKEPTPAIQRKMVADFSVRATNYLSSLLSPLPPAFFGLGVLLLIAAALLRSGSAGTESRLRGTLREASLILAVASFGTWVVLTFDGAGYTDAPSPRAIKVQAPHVAPEKPAEVVGSLVADDGTVAVAEVEGGRFDVDGLERAGEYKGTVDLLPADEGTGDPGSVTVKANVRDFWAYAFIVIGLGVLIGYLVTNYFTRLRPLDQQRVRIGDFINRMNAEEEKFTKAYGTRLQRGLNMKERAKARIARVDDMLEHGDAGAAKKAMDDLETYYDNFVAFRADVNRMDDLADELAHAVTEAPLDVDTTEVFALQEARRLLLRAFDSTEIDAKSTLLDDRTKAVTALNELLDDLILMISVFARQMERIPDDADDSKEAKFKDLVGKTLVAADGAQAKTDWEAAQTAYRELMDSLSEAKRAVVTIDAAVLLASRARRKAEALAISEQEPAPTVAPGAIPVPESQLSWTTFRDHDRQMTFATGFLAIGSGLGALYMTSAAWGSPSDYLQALLWGSVVSEGAKYFTSTITKLVPSAE